MRNFAGERQGSPGSPRKIVGVDDLLTLAEARRLLGVTPDADPADVRAAFRARVRAVHPDTAVGVAATDLGVLCVARDLALAAALHRPATEARCRATGESRPVRRIVGSRRTRLVPADRTGPSRGYAPRPGSIASTWEARV